MSWDADLYDDRGHLEGEWNYTHNCNGMANAVLDADYQEPLGVFDEVFRVSDVAKSNGETWWRQLDGLTGAKGAELLGRIIEGLESDRARFRAMQPDNGWGSYDSFLSVLREMHKASLVEWPTKWSVSG